MIFKKTKLDVVDNSGASVVKCIHVVSKGKNKTFSGVGDIIKITVKRLRKSIPKKKVKKSEVTTALIVYQKSKIMRKNGLYLKGGNNYVIILNKELNNLVASRVVRPVCSEIRSTNFSKILTLSPQVI